MKEWRRVMKNEYEEQNEEFKREMKNTKRSKKRVQYK